jgi:hypothetical protein
MSVCDIYLNEFAAMSGGASQPDRYGGRPRLACDGLPVVGKRLRVIDVLGAPTVLIHPHWLMIREFLKRREPYSLGGSASANPCRGLDVRSLSCRRVCGHDVPHDPPE